jgi:molecular chaperone IbpA
MRKQLHAIPVDPTVPVHTGLRSLFREFDKFLPNTVGFDTFLDRMDSSLDTVNRLTTNYPPHNIVKTSDDTYVIEIAVAGLDLKNVSVEYANSTLEVAYTSSVDDSKESAKYLYRGIAQRSFTKAFALGDHVVVDGAKVVDGILKIALRAIVPEEKRSRKITIEGLN